MLTILWNQGYSPSTSGGTLFLGRKPSTGAGVARISCKPISFSAGRVVATGGASAFFASAGTSLQPRPISARGVQNMTDEQLLAALELLNN